MKTILAAIALSTLATASVAGNAGGTFGFGGANISGAFSGGVSAGSASGGLSATGSSPFRNGTTSIRNESGAGQFSGSSLTFDSTITSNMKSNGNNPRIGFSGGTTMTADTISEGFDYSKTIDRGGFGGSGAFRDGSAGAVGNYGGSFGSSMGSGFGNW